MSTNIHTQHVSKRYCSYYCFIHLSTLNSKKEIGEQRRLVVLIPYTTFVITNTVRYSVYKLMPPKRIFFQQQSRGNSSGDFPSEINANHNNQLIDNTAEQRDTIEPLQSINTNLISSEEQHRTRRRSSVQILDIKFLHSLSNQFDNAQSNDPINAPDDACECEKLTILSLWIFFPLLVVED